MAPAGSRGPVGVDHFQPDTRAYRGHSFCSFSQWIWVTSDSVFLSWHLKNHLKPLLFLSLGSDEEEGRYRSGDEVVLDIILSFLQFFSVTQSFILFHFPRTITCRQLMEVQHTVVKSTGSWARQAISSSSKTILLKTLKIEEKKSWKFWTLSSSFLWLKSPIFCVAIPSHSACGQRATWTLASSCFVGHSPHPFSLESGRSYSNIMTADSKVGVFSLYAAGKSGVCLSSHLTVAFCNGALFTPAS